MKLRRVKGTKLQEFARPFKELRSIAKTRQRIRMGGLAVGSLAAGGTLAKAANGSIEDQKKDKNWTRGKQRIKNALVTATGGGFLGSLVHSGKSGLAGARVGAALGAAAGLLHDPKKRTKTGDAMAGGGDWHFESTHYGVIRAIGRAASGDLLRDAATAHVSKISTHHKKRKGKHMKHHSFSAEDDALFYSTAARGKGRLNVAQDRYRKSIHEKDIEKGTHNYIRAGAAGAGIGMLLNKTGSLKRAGAIGAVAGLGSQAIVRGLTKRTKDKFGERSHKGKLADKIIPIAGEAAAGIIGYRKLAKSAIGHKIGLESRLRPVHLSTLAGIDLSGLKMISPRMRHKLIVGGSLAGGIAGADAIAAGAFAKKGERKKKALHGLKYGAIYGSALAGLEPIISKGLRKVRLARDVNGEILLGEKPRRSLEQNARDVAIGAGALGVGAGAAATGIGVFRAAQIADDLHPHAKAALHSIKQTADGANAGLKKATRPLRVARVVQRNVGRFVGKLPFGGKLKKVLPRFFAYGDEPNWHPQYGWQHPQPVQSRRVITQSDHDEVRRDRRKLAIGAGVGAVGAAGAAAYIGQDTAVGKAAKAGYKRGGLSGAWTGAKNHLKKTSADAAALRKQASTPPAPAPVTYAAPVAKDPVHEANLAKLAAEKKAAKDFRESPEGVAQRLKKIEDTKAKRAKAAAPPVVNASPAAQAAHNAKVAEKTKPTKSKAPAAKAPAAKAPAAEVAKGANRAKSAAKQTIKKVLKKAKHLSSIEREILFYRDTAGSAQVTEHPESGSKRANVYRAIIDPDKRGYFIGNIDKRRATDDNPKGKIYESVPILHRQVVNRAMKDAKGVAKWGQRGHGLVKDTVDVVRGVPRGYDASGRKKKREWEKSWFKNAALGAAGGAAILGGLRHIGKNPTGKLATNVRKLRHGVDNFRTQTGFSSVDREILFDESQGDWDIRDARGRSARVFAPGSQARVRREKMWHEKLSNERKLWGAGAAAAALAGAAITHKALKVSNVIPKVAAAPSAKAVVRGMRRPRYTPTPRENLWKHPVKPNEPHKTDWWREQAKSAS